jgi:phospholipid/cholesterol/gamma-HCH transport system substrate-binding protein
METRPPTVTRILIAVGFAISCFALFLFLWVTFGGPIPLKSEGYRFTVPVDEATQLAVESDVRISGVSVGKVKRIDLGDGGKAEATVELDSKYAPIPTDTNATLRQKTLLGETYIELSPGSQDGPTLKEGGTLAASQVAPSVQLDEIFRAFDPKTREAFQTWMQSSAVATSGRGEDISNAIASLEPFADEANTTLRLLDSQKRAVGQLIRDGGESFQALSERQGQLSGLIRNSNRVFQTTARRNAELEDTFRIFPTFLRESRTTLARLETFARTSDPVVRQLRPAIQELSPTLISLGKLAPNLKRFFVGLDRAIPLSESGFGALRGLLDDQLPPLLGRLDPYLASFNPIFQGLRNYKHEVTALLGNVTAATNGINDPAPTQTAEQHYLATEAPLSPEALAAYPNRITTNRPNPYIKAGGYGRLKRGLQVFENFQCTAGANVTYDTSPAARANFNADHPDIQIPDNQGNFPLQPLFDRIQKFAFGDQTSTATIPAPPCAKQPPQKSLGRRGQRTDYPHALRER